MNIKWLQKEIIKAINLSWLSVKLLVPVKRFGKMVFWSFVFCSHVVMSGKLLQCSAPRLLCADWDLFSRVLTIICYVICTGYWPSIFSLADTNTKAVLVEENSSSLYSRYLQINVDRIIDRSSKRLDVCLHLCFFLHTSSISRKVKKLEGTGSFILTCSSCCKLVSVRQNTSIWLSKIKSFTESLWRERCYVL